MSTLTRAPDTLFRLYGVAVTFFSLKTYVSCYQAQPELLTSPGAWSLHALSLTALLLIWRGAHPLLLSLAFGCSVRCLIATHRASEPLLWFPAAEWPLFIALPLLTLISLFMSRPRDPQLTLMGFRLSFLGAMGWAGVHKLNQDFFNPQVSCARLSERLTAWWGVPEWVYTHVSPALIVSAELGVGCLLLWRPRWGALMAVLILGHFGSIGATALASVMIAMALAFLSPAELRAFRSAPQHRPLLSICIVILAVTLSYYAYQGSWSWLQYGLFHGLISLILIGLVAVLRSDVTAPRVNTLPNSRAHRRFATLILLGWTLNGLTPYLGLKFHYSFAMLSNLRVDDHRWNSHLISKRWRWSEYDGRIQVREVVYRARSTGRLLRGGPLKPGLYPPSSLRAYLESADQAQEYILAHVSYRGRSHNFLNQPPQRLREWLGALPDTPLVQKKLTLDQPQRCIH